MKIIGLIAVVVVTLLVGSYFLTSSRNNTPTPSSRIGPFPTDIEQQVQPTSDTSALRAGGSSYLDSEGIYNFLYPPDYKLDTSDEVHIRIYKAGATQTGQTEMYDGVLVVFETINRGNQTLEQWVDNNIKNSTADGTLKIINPKKATTINGYPGFTYRTQGLGEAEYYVFAKDDSSKNALVITTAVNDPKNVGFENEVKTILSTVELFK